jgi:hypothetical protein
MQNFYKHFPEIDSVYWTNYFLNEFIPKNKFFENTSFNTRPSYISYFKKDFNDESKILELSSLLTEKLKFPPIEYFIIFRHVVSQFIHADGQTALRNSSFNLPLTGYQGTKMWFYNTKSNIVPEIRDAHYFKKDDVRLISELSGTNEWVLVNSAVPHNIVNIDSNNPRLTVCIRFVGNPKFEDLITTEVRSLGVCH